MIGACLDEQIQFSLTLSQNRRITNAIKAIDHDAVTPGALPRRRRRADTGALIRDAEVAETTHTLTMHAS